MPYIIKDKSNKYYIISNLGDQIVDFEYFPVDELIAIPIQKLCNKGYITEFSCSGHPYNFIDYDCSDEKKNSNYFYHDELECWVTYSFISEFRESYISFKEDISFESLPEGWIYENRTLRKHYDNSLDEILFYEQLIKEMKKLASWIDTLPDYK